MKKIFLLVALIAPISTFLPISYAMEPEAQDQEHQEQDKETILENPLTRTVAAQKFFHNRSASSIPREYLHDRPNGQPLIHHDRLSHSAHCKRKKPTRPVFKFTPELAENDENNDEAEAKENGQNSPQQALTPTETPLAIADPNDSHQESPEVDQPNQAPHAEKIHNNTQLTPPTIQQVPLGKRIPQTPQKSIVAKRAPTPLASAMAFMTAKILKENASELEKMAFKEYNKLSNGLLSNFNNQLKQRARSCENEEQVLSMAFMIAEELNKNNDHDDNEQEEQPVTPQLENLDNEEQKELEQDVQLTDTQVREQERPPRRSYACRALGTELEQAEDWENHVFKVLIDEFLNPEQQEGAQAWFRETLSPLIRQNEGKPPKYRPLAMINNFKEFLRQQNFLKDPEKITRYNKLVKHIHQEYERKCLPAFLLIDSDAAETPAPMLGYELGPAGFGTEYIAEQAAMLKNLQQRQRAMQGGMGGRPNYDGFDDKETEEAMELSRLEAKRAEAARAENNNDARAAALPADAIPTRIPSGGSLGFEQNRLNNNNAPYAIRPQDPSNNQDPESNGVPEQQLPAQDSDIISPRTVLTAKVSGAVILLASLFKYRNDMYDGVIKYIKAVGNIFRKPNKKTKPKVISRPAKKPVLMNPASSMTIKTGKQ